MARFGKAFNELKTGDTFQEALTITEAHLSHAAGLFNDYNALHTDEPNMQRSRFGKRIAHGALTFGLMVGVYSKVFYDTDISTVEASISFTAPIYINDTITFRWEVSELEPKPKLDGGLVTLRGEAINQDGTVTAKTSAKLLVGNDTIFNK
ncbi:MAG: dehydratase [Candidatus Dadabacteria bacterium]|nr:dehydratase [Candidatus Dadabacteria bacterium]